MAARVTFNDQPSQPPGNEEEGEASAEDVGATDKCSQVVDVGGAEARGCDVDRPHDGVVSCVPKEWAGRPAHPEAAEEEGGRGGENWSNCLSWASLSTSSSVTWGCTIEESTGDGAQTRVIGWMYVWVLAQVGRKGNACTYARMNVW